MIMRSFRVAVFVMGLALLFGGAVSGSNAQDLCGGAAASAKSNLLRQLRPNAATVSNCSTQRFAATIKQGCCSPTSICNCHCTDPDHCTFLGSGATTGNAICSGGPNNTRVNKSETCCVNQVNGTCSCGLNSGPSISYCPTSG
jgi:hypothetical protein